MRVSEDEAREFMARHLYFDAHGHPDGTIPAALRLAGGNRGPRDVKLDELASAGLGGAVLCAIGDPGSFIPVKVDTWKTVRRQLEGIKSKIADGDGLVATGPEDMRPTAPETRARFLLGVEGGDCLGGLHKDSGEAVAVGRLESLYAAGVRALVMVHYSRNALGSIAYGWGGKLVPDVEQTGLTALGAKVLERARDLGIIVDLAHADEATIFACLDSHPAPYLCSHTGPRALQDFPRYISDEAMKAIAQNGGIIGLWPYFDGKRGVRDLETFGNYLRHCADTVGPEHVCLGTDLNGVPGYMAGYADPTQAWKLVAAVLELGFSEKEAEGVVGKNFIDFWKLVDGGRKNRARA